MPDYFRLAAEALPDPGVEGSWERRMAEGIRSLGSFEGRAVGRFDSRGSFGQRLHAALSPKPTFRGRTTSQLLVNGSKRDLWLACLRAVANISADQTGDFTAPDDTPLEDLPGWTQNPGNGAQPGDLKIVGNAVAQARLIDNGVAYIGPPTGKHNKKNSAALLETVQQQGYIAPLVEDSGNWAGTTYDPASGKLKADKAVNGTVTPLGEVTATVSAGDQIGGTVYGDNYYITHAGAAVAGPFSLGGSHAATTRSGLIAKGAATDAWIDDYSAGEQSSAPSVGGYGTHSWWRLYIDQGDTGNTETQIGASLQFRTASGGGQAATGGTAFAGGAGTGTTFADPNAPFAETNVYRRTVDSAWWIGYHFATPTAIVEIRLRGGGIRGRCITNARFQYSDDSTDGSDGTWTDAFSIYDPLQGVNEDAVWPQDLSGASGYKAYRFVWTATPTANRTIISELEMLKSGVDYTSSLKCNFLGVDGPNMCDDSAGTDVSSVTVSAGTAVMSMATPVLIDGYSVQASAVSTGGARCPRDWTVAGSNDGSSWTTLSTKAGETFTNGQKKTYAI